MQKKIVKKSGVRNAKKILGGKIEKEKTFSPIGRKESALLDKILRIIKPSLSLIRDYKEPFSGKVFPNKFDAIIFKTNRIESKFSKTFLRIGEIVLGNREGIFLADKIGEKYLANSLPAYVLSYYKPSFPNYRIRETVLKSVENDREGGGETKGILSFKLVKV